MSRFDRFVDLLARVNGAVATLSFAALTVVVSLQVFTRFVLEAPLIWSEEVARFLFFWTVLLGAALSVRHRRHFIIDVLPGDTAGRHPRGWLAVLWRAVPALTIAGFCFFLLVQGIAYTEVGTFRIGTNSRVNMALVYAAIPVFAGLSLFYGLLQLVADVRHARRGDPQPSVQPPAD